MFTFLEMKESVVFNLANKDYTRLGRLRIMDRLYFDAVIEEIEREMDIDLKKELTENIIGY